MQMTSSRRGVLSPTVGPTDPYAEPHIYYGTQTDAAIGRSVHRTRTLSSVSILYVIITNTDRLVLPQTISKYKPFEQMLKRDD